MIPSPRSGGAAPLCPRAAARFHPFGALGRLHVRFARREDAPRLAQTLRPADREELAALGETPLAALTSALGDSRRSYAALDAEDRLIALFGVCETLGAPPGSDERPAGLRIGAPWMLGSPALEASGRAFLKGSRGWVDHLGRDCDLLLNWVDARNAVHVAWLRWCGFTFLRRAPRGPEGRDFLEFVRLPAAPSSSPSRF